MPSVGGSHWEALSLMHVAERQAWIFLSFFLARISSEEEKKKYYVGRGNYPCINNLLIIPLKGKGDTLAQRSRDSPPPQSYKPESANGDLEHYWKHPAPGPGCEKYCCFQ
eukprot:571689-Pelagomonas_calceolata.AAC.1